MAKVCFAICVIACITVAVPGLAADRVIYNGIDLWATSEDGSTFVDFSENPLPAQFLCYKSEPFTGRVGFKGVPVATSEPGLLGRTDTIVQRLDDAVFNKRGVAFSRLQVRSLYLKSLSPIKTSCGLFTATVVLDGEQPITRMKIVRENPKGGRFFAPIAVNVKISFKPVNGVEAEPLEIRKSLRFPPLPNQRWMSLPAQERHQAKGVLLVDTDGDQMPDTYLPGTSNFAVGQMLAGKGSPCSAWEDPEGNVHCCHQFASCQHCVD